MMHRCTTQAIAALGNPVPRKFNSDVIKHKAYIATYPCLTECTVAMALRRARHAFIK